MFGKSIFMEFHEQGMGHKIAGFYSPEQNISDDDIRGMFEVILDCKLGERDNVVIIDHRKVYAQRILGEELDDNIFYTLNKFFPEAITNVDNTATVDEFFFCFHNSKADEFIWNNRLHEKIQAFVAEELKRSSEEYMAKRKEQKAKERQERGISNN